MCTGSSNAEEASDYLLYKSRCCKCKKNVKIDGKCYFFIEGFLYNTLIARFEHGAIKVLQKDDRREIGLSRSESSLIGLYSGVKYARTTSQFWHCRGRNLPMLKGGDFEFIISGDIEFKNGAVHRGSRALQVLQRVFQHDVN